MERDGKYRATTLGQSLGKVLVRLSQDKSLSRKEAKAILTAFDKVRRCFAGGSGPGWGWTWKPFAVRNACPQPFSSRALLSAAPFKVMTREVAEARHRPEFAATFNAVLDGYNCFNELWSFDLRDVRLASDASDRSGSSVASAVPRNAGALRLVVQEAPRRHRRGEAVVRYEEAPASKRRRT